MHTEQEILHVFMDLPNELCSVPTVCYTLPFFFFSRKMIGFQLLIWEKGPPEPRTKEVWARRLFSTDNQVFRECAFTYLLLMKSLYFQVSVTLNAT